MESSIEAVRVTRLLRKMIDEEDVVRDFADQARVQKLEQLAIAQVEQASEDQYEGRRAKAEKELRHKDNDRKGADGSEQSAFVLCEPMLVAYDSLTNVLCPPRSPSANIMPTGPMPAASTAQQQQQTQPPSPSPLETSATPGGTSNDALSSSVPLGRIYSAPAWGPEEWTPPGGGNQATPTPPTQLLSSHTSSNAAIPPPPALMRNESHGNSSNSLEMSSGSLWAKDPDEMLLEKALYLSGLEVTPTVSMDWVEGSASAIKAGDFKYDDDDERVGPPPVYDELVPSPPPPPKPAVSTSVLQLETLANFYHEDFDHLRQSGEIRVSYANTYQGRLPESTNGCTVIAPLLCIHHLFEDPDIIPDPSLPDAVIEQVIDFETPAILTELRTKLGLSAQAFLIPSDAHDYLIENGQLCQEQFINVIGGNILNESHLQAFIDALVHDPGGNSSDPLDGRQRRRKVAACWFFHEHVVAILKVRRDHNDTCWYDVIDGLPLKQTLAWVNESDEHFSSHIGLTESQELLSDAFLPKTARIRCLNAQALTACLRWYACSKFTADNMSYIDQYPWDDNSCDFDPRVFQGFIWGSMA